MSALKKFTYELPEGPLVIEYEVPSEAVYDRFEDGRKRSESAARTILVKTCVKSHSGVELDALFARYPAVKHGISMVLLKAAGAMLEFNEGEPGPS